MTSPPPGGRLERGPPSIEDYRRRRLYAALGFVETAPASLGMRLKT